MVHSLTGNFERMDGLINLLSLGVYLLLLLNTLKSTKEWLWIFRTSIITSLLVVAYEIFGRWGWIGDVPIPHNAGTIGNTLFLGSYLMFNVFFALLNFYIDKKKYWKIFYLLAIVIDVVFIFINASRSSMIGLVVGLGVLLLLMFFRVNKKTEKHLSDIFKKYQTGTTEFGFDTTEIKIKLYTTGTIYVSRSQARRVMAGLEEFESIILDFDKVSKHIVEKDIIFNFSLSICLCISRM